ncbi:DUF1949 domain-containing protein [Candidatus Poribacteria bacterium]|nr:DUF1949 domain-containing protein [Candidatus Poribacteria bacterium]
MSGEYQAIIGIATAKYVVKKSRFYADATAIQNRDEAKTFVSDVQGRIRQATHYCFAYSLSNGDDKLEYSTDAGEPTNSAGPPILAAIGSAGLSNTIIVIARYYGGVKLGVGGLIRAYSTCARLCIENATLVTRIYYQDLRVKTTYNRIGTVVNLCERLGGQVINIEYDPNPNITIRIQQTEIATLQEQIQNIGITSTSLK